MPPWRASLALAFAGACGVAIGSACGDSPLQPSDRNPDAQRDAAEPADRRGDEPWAPSVVEAGLLDGGFLPPGRWRPLGISNCAALVSTEPEVAVPTFPWRDCTSQRTGCKTFVTPLQKTSAVFFRQSFRSTPYEDEAGVHLSYRHDIGGLDAGSIALAVQQLLDGPAELVVAGPSKGASCHPQHIDTTVQGVAMVIRQQNLRSDGSFADPSVYVAHRGAGAVDFSFGTIHEQLGGLFIVQGLSAGDGFAAVEHTGGGAVFPAAFRFSDGRALAAHSPRREGAFVLSAGAGYYALVDGNVTYVPLGSGGSVVVRPSAGKAISFFSVDRSRGNELVWGEISTDPSQTATDFFATPFATTEGAALRRAVAKVPWVTGGVVNAGVMAMPLPDNRIRIIRTSDGSGWDLDGEEDAYVQPTVWVNDDYVWVWSSSLRPGQPGFPFVDGMTRYARPSGLPSVPNGL